MRRFVSSLFFAIATVGSLCAPTPTYAGDYNTQKKTAIDLVARFFSETVSIANGIEKVEDSVSYANQFSGLLSYMDWDFINDEIIQFSCPGLTNAQKEQFKALFPNHLLKSLLSKTLIEGVKGAKLELNKRLIQVSGQESLGKDGVRVRVQSKAGSGPDSMHHIVWLINVQNGVAKIYTVKFDDIDPLAAKKEELKSIYNTLKDKPDEFLAKLK